MIDLPEYKLDRPLSEEEKTRRKLAHEKLNDFIIKEGIENFEVIELYAVSHGIFALRTPNFDWTIQGKLASIGYDYDKETESK